MARGKKILFSFARLSVQPRNVLGFIWLIDWSLNSDGIWGREKGLKSLLKRFCGAWGSIILMLTQRIHFSLGNCRFEARNFRGEKASVAVLYFDTWAAPIVWRLTRRRKLFSSVSAWMACKIKLEESRKSISRWREEGEREDFILKRLQTDLNVSSPPSPFTELKKKRLLGSSPRSTSPAIVFPQTAQINLLCRNDFISQLRSPFSTAETETVNKAQKINLRRD